MSQKIVPETQLDKITSARFSVRHLEMLDQLRRNEKNILKRGEMLRALIERAYEKKVTNAHP